MPDDVAKVIHSLRCKELNYAAGMLERMQTALILFKSCEDNWHKQMDKAEQRIAELEAPVLPDDVAEMVKALGYRRQSYLDHDEWKDTVEKQAADMLEHLQRNYTLSQDQVKGWRDEVVPDLQQYIAEREGILLEAFQDAKENGYGHLKFDEWCKLLKYRLLEEI